MQNRIQTIPAGSRHFVADSIQRLIDFYQNTGRPAEAAMFLSRKTQILELAAKLVVSCDRLGKNPLAYLTDVLHRIDRTPVAQLRDLLPDRWEPPTEPTPPAEPISAN